MIKFVRAVLSGIPRKSPDHFQWAQFSGREYPSMIDLFRCFISQMNSSPADTTCSYLLSIIDLEFQFSFHSGKIRLSIIYDRNSVASIVCVFDSSRLLVHVEYLQMGEATQANKYKVKKFTIFLRSTKAQIFIIY